MAETQQGMRKAQGSGTLPGIDLFPRVKYNGRTIDAAVFGSRVYNKNIAAMRERYSHSKDLPNVTFRPLTTAESLAVAGYGFRSLAKPQIFDPIWLQAGLVLRATEGVWINPLRDDNGYVLMDEQALEQRLDGIRPVYGIYLLDGDTSFVPHASFERRVQEHGKFLEGGLARGLVHTADKKATTLSSIANRDVYPDGVDVWAFEPVINPIFRVVELGSGWYFDGNWFVVGGCGYGGGLDGFAFGGLVSGEASAPRN